MQENDVETGRQILLSQNASSQGKDPPKIKQKEFRNKVKFFSTYARAPRRKV
jgi:hypothetical protein